MRAKYLFALMLSGSVLGPAFGQEADTRSGVSGVMQALMSASFTAREKGDQVAMLRVESGKDDYSLSCNQSGSGVVTGVTLLKNSTPQETTDDQWVLLRAVCRNFSS